MQRPILSTLQSFVLRFALVPEKVRLRSLPHPWWWLCPWNPEQIQEVIYADYYATLKRPAEIAARVKREIAALSSLETIDAIISQDKLPDVHKQYVLAIEDQLPSSLEVSKLIKKWSALGDPHMLAKLRRGAGVMQAETVGCNEEPATSGIPKNSPLSL
jgi:hypothetical protein